MEERELVAIIEREVEASIGGGGAGAGSSGVTAGGTSTHPSAQLATERAQELDYYNSRPFGNERDGESQVVSSDVFDAIEGMLPHLLKTFTASDDAVEFQPEGMEDDEAAKQRTDTCNYVFYRQNNGFVLMYEWFKDALLQKNGVVKYWWEEKTDITEDEYKGLTEGEYLMMKQDGDVEILSESNYDDPDEAQKKAQILEKLNVAAKQNPQAQMLSQQIEQAPVPQLYDCKIKTTKDASKICIKAIPPEEFGISSKHRCISIQDAPFVYHRTKMSLSALRQMGCPDEVIEELNGDDDGVDTKPEVLSRNRFIDEASRGTDSIDETTREVWVVDCFIRIDEDEDGIAELRHIIMPGRTIWIDEPASHINFAAITPIIMPHRFIGKSIAEVVMDLQFLNSTLWRQMLNNLYLTNNPQKVVLGSAGGMIQADVDRLLTTRVGGIQVEYSPNAIRPLEIPFVAGASFPMLEYIEAKKEQRTGITRYNQGTDADSLNKTARGIQMIQTAAQQKMDLIARIFAETGVKDLFRGIAYFLSKYSTKKMTLKLRGKWVDINPRQWKSQFDMTVNVGLGSGNKDAQLVHLVKMHETQLELIKAGRGYLVTDENIFNWSNKMAENMGFKHPEMFVSDPKSVQKPPPQPNPEMVKIQQAHAEVQMKIQSNEKIRQFDAHTQKEVETIKANAMATIEQMRIQAQQFLEKMRLDHQSQLEIFKANSQPQPVDDSALKMAMSDRELETRVWEKKLDVAGKIEVAQIASKTSLTETAMQAESDANLALQDAITGPSGESVTQNPVKPLDTLTKLSQQSMKQHGESMKQLTGVLDGIRQGFAESMKEKPKAKKKHQIKKTADGYEITTQ